jgi:hypothetical protein
LKERGMNLYRSGVGEPLSLSLAALRSHVYTTAKVSAKPGDGSAEGKGEWHKFVL